MRQRDQAMVMCDEFVAFARRQKLRVVQQIFLDLVADHFCQNQLTEPRGAERECGFI